MNSSDDRFVRMPEVVRKTGQSRASIYRLIAAGRFPKQEVIGKRAVGWRLSALMRWMEAPMAYHAPPEPRD